MFPRVLLRLEGAVVLGLGIAAYAFLNVSWWLFAVLFFVPDVFMAGYLSGPRLGAVLYNVGHTYVVPLLLGAYGFKANAALLEAVALIWVAHIGFDRLMGFGLKYASGFRDTHLGNWKGVAGETLNREQ